MTDLTSCPGCGAVAEIDDRFVLESTDGPVDHVRTVCVLRHWYVLPAASMPCLPRARGTATDAGRRAARP